MSGSPRSFTRTGACQRDLRVSLLSSTLLHASSQPRRKRQGSLLNLTNNPRPQALKPSSPLTLSPSHPLTLSPSHPTPLSPSHPLTLSPSHPLTLTLAASFVRCGRSFEARCVPSGSQREREGGAGWPPTCPPSSLVIMALLVRSPTLCPDRSQSICLCRGVTHTQAGAAAGPAHQDRYRTGHARARAWHRMRHRPSLTRSRMDMWMCMWI